MKRLMVAMYRPDTDDLPLPTVRPDLRLRWFHEGDEKDWARIEHSAGEFVSEQAAWERFSRDFPNGSALTDRCLFIENEFGDVVGTAMAISGILDGRKMGRLGWVAVMPQYQGQGVGKWVVSSAMQRIAQEYGEIYLTTQTTSIAAISIYLKYGFIPHPYGPDDKVAWRLLSEALDRGRLA